MDWKKMNDEEKLRELRRTVRNFLREISSVPMRAVDCDQDEVARLEAKLVEMSGYKGFR